MQRPVHEASPHIRPVYDGVTVRPADGGQRPVGSSPHTRVGAHYEVEILPEVSGAEKLAQAGVTAKRLTVQS